MGKRGKGKVDRRKEKLDADLDEGLDEFEPSDSEEEFGKDEKILLDKRRGTKATESEEEVFGLESSEDDKDEDEGNDQCYGGGVGSDMDSDIEGKGSDYDSEAGLPDSKAWGRRSIKYYHTDYVDQDFGGMSKEDEEMADMEEQEAANIQKRLMSHMEETDFTLGLLNKVEEKKMELSKKSEIDESEKIVSDLSNVSTSEKIQLLKQESPELFKLIDDFKENMGLAQNKLLPIINLVKSGKLESCTATDFVQTLFSIIINYSMNIVFYLLLKSKRSGPIDDHPVIQRLYTYKKVTDEMLITLEDNLIDQIDSIIDTSCNGIELEAKYEDSRQIKNMQLRILGDAKKTERLIEKKKANLIAKKGGRIEDVLCEDEGEEDLTEEEMDEYEEEDDMESKRAITYEMKKNKGLTPRRKKEDRNPRVKHRNKYKKAKIRRKGQVREVRTEVNKYGGEMFGIKTHTTKSIKLKV